MHSPHAHGTHGTTKAVRGKRCTKTPQPPLTTAISKAEVGRLLPALAPLPTAAQLCPPRQRDPRKLPATRQMGACASALCPPGRASPHPAAPPAGLCLPLPLPPKPGINEQLPGLQTKAAVWGCKPRQWVWGSWVSAPHLGTLHPTAPPEPHHTELPPAHSGHQQPGTPEPSQDCWDQGTSSGATEVSPSASQPALPGRGGFASPLCIPPPTDLHSSFPSSREDPSPCWAA